MPEPKASVSDKKKFFEKAMEEHHQPSPKPGIFKLNTLYNIYLINN